MSFDKPRHIKYWMRCLKTLLPTQYTSNDSNRMYLAFFIVGALDLLNVDIPSDETRGCIDWIYRCQHPGGGFRMWPGTDFGNRANKTNAPWDPANIPATYFALASLLILGDDMTRVRRRQTLEWLREMQRQDGSFGELLVNGQIEGNRDPRFGYCATGIRHILRGPSCNGPDVDIDGLISCVRGAESYDGGIADVHFHEPHAGYTFCSLGALAFVDRLNIKNESPSTLTNDSVLRAPKSPQAVLRWLVWRQTERIDPDTALDSEFQYSVTAQVEETDDTQSSQPLHQSPDKSTARLVSVDTDAAFASMTGRPNKVADTCYAFWVGASLQILGRTDLMDRQAVRRYLLHKVQHAVLGGFGKFPGDLPDLYHSYLGLAALGLAGSTGVKELDGGMCLSKEARARLPDLWKSWSV